MPSFMQLHGRSYESLGTLDWLTYDMTLLEYDASTKSAKILKCPESALANCRITLSRAYTPVLYYMQPPVMYYGSETSLIVDPRSS